MLAFAVKRLGVALLVALTVSLITFSMIYVSGDPAIAIAGEGARAEDIEAIRKFYGFDRPIAAQYLDWLIGALQGDFGRSYHMRQPVADVIFARLPTTMILGAAAIAFALLLSIPLGVGSPPCVPTASSTGSRSPLRWSARPCRPSGSRSR